MFQVATFFRMANQCLWYLHKKQEAESKASPQSAGLGKKHYGQIFDLSVPQLLKAAHLYQKNLTINTNGPIKMEVMPYICFLFRLMERELLIAQQKAGSANKPYVKYWCSSLPWLCAVHMNIGESSVREACVLCILENLMGPECSCQYFGRGQNMLIFWSFTNSIGYKLIVDNICNGRSYFWARGKHLRLHQV